MVPLEKDDDLVDRLIEHHPEFKKMLKKRLREKTVSAKEASRRLSTRWRIRNGHSKRTVREDAGGTPALPVASAL